MKMEHTQCSETLAFKLQTPGNHPKESIRHSKHGEILKSGFFWHSASIYVTELKDNYKFVLLLSLFYVGARGGAVVEALRYKP
jgi:hypothetical protein